MAEAEPDTGQGAIAPVVFLPGVREADERRAENASLHALGRRAQSRAEVVELLRRREIDPIVIEAEVARLERVGLVDDGALALTLVERLADRKKLGVGALRAELQRRKLDAAAIEAALATREGDDDRDLLAGLVDDRLRRMGELDRDTAERRLLGYLARKGHGGGAAREAVRAALDEAGVERLPRTGFGQRRGLGQRGGVGQRGGRGPGARAGGPRRVEFE